MDPAIPRAGFVLVGGNSSRMGRDKAGLPLLGRTLVEHVAAAVAEAAGSVTLIGPPGRYSSLDFPIIADWRPGLGPLGGIHTALTHSPAVWNLIAACDLPQISGEETEWTAEVRGFGDDFARRTGLPVHWIDERLTSVMAEHAVRGMGLRKGQREQKERVDAAAAALILTAYLRQLPREV